jgi:hypothetical protein
VPTELVSFLRGAAAACNVTLIVVGDGLRAAGWLNGRGRCGKQTRGRFNYAGRRLRGHEAATEPEIVESGPSLT